MWLDNSLWLEGLEARRLGGLKSSKANSSKLNNLVFTGSGLSLATFFWKVAKNKIIQ
jgi:hypothetical protein